MQRIGAFAKGRAAAGEVMEKLQNKRKLESFRDEIQHHSLLALLDAFEEEGIDCLPLKGIWMKQFYPDPSLRMMADLDILYRPEQLEKVESVLFCGGITSTRRSIPSAKSR